MKQMAAGSLLPPAAWPLAATPRWLPSHTPDRRPTRKPSTPCARMLFTVRGGLDVPTVRFSDSKDTSFVSVDCGALDGSRAAR